MGENLSAHPKKPTRRNAIVIAAIAAIIACAAATSIVACSLWLNTVIYCYGGCGYFLSITNVALKQVGIATFNVTNIWGGNITITQANVSWNNGGQQVTALVKSGNIVPAKGFLALSVNFTIVWQGGVLYEFALLPNKGHPATASHRF